MILSDLYQVIDDTTMVSLATEYGNMLAPMSAIRNNLTDKYKEADVYSLSAEDNGTVRIILEEAI